MMRFRSFRNIAAPQSPLPVLAAAAAAWNDDAHAAENRALYQKKIDAAERILGNRFGFYRPAGGFFLWLDVGDGEAAARQIWEKGGVKVLPGKYLSRDDEAGNPGEAYIRVALVHPQDTTEDGLKRLANALG
jgi:aspartate/methionine/tyrosine aminotransferase